MIENFSWNIDLFYFLNSFSEKDIFFEKIAIFLGEYLIFILLSLFLFYFFRLIWKDKKVEIKEFFWYFSGVFVAYIIAKIIKFSFPIERPFSFLENINYLVSESAFSSFPSAHATFAFALAMSVYLYNKKIGIWFFVGAFLASLGRIFVGVHYPLDILVGGIWGIVVVWIFYKIWNKKINSK